MMDLDVVLAPDRGNGAAVAGIELFTREVHIKRPEPALKYRAIYNHEVACILRVQELDGLWIHRT